jgi:hypothetical protein
MAAAAAAAEAEADEDEDDEEGDGDDEEEVTGAYFAMYYIQLDGEISCLVVH